MVGPELVSNLGLLLNEILRGNPLLVGALASFGHSDILEASKGADAATLLKRDSVVAVLEGLRDGLWTVEEVQPWASFLRRGYVVGGVNTSLRPINFDYESQYEDEIVEVVGRLDEIGDMVDGDLSRQEVSNLLHILRG